MMGCFKFFKLRCTIVFLYTSGNQSNGSERIQARRPKTMVCSNLILNPFKTPMSWWYKGRDVKLVLLQVWYKCLLKKLNMSCLGVICNNLCVQMEIEYMYKLFIICVGFCLWIWLIGWYIWVDTNSQSMCQLWHVKKINFQALKNVIRNGSLIGYVFFTLVEPSFSFLFSINQSQLLSNL